MLGWNIFGAIIIFFIGFIVGVSVTIKVLKEDTDEIIYRVEENLKNDGYYKKEEKE